MQSIYNKVGRIVWLFNAFTRFYRGEFGMEKNQP